MLSSDYNSKFSNFHSIISKNRQIVNSENVRMHLDSSQNIIKSLFSQSALNSLSNNNLKQPSVKQSSALQSNDSHVMYSMVDLNELISPPKKSFSQFKK
jgi:hypothetical protein